jgi:hypothetical protein
MVLKGVLQKVIPYNGIVYSKEIFEREFKKYQRILRLKKLKRIINE